MQVIEFPDVEDALRLHLTDVLPDYGSAATAHLTIPDPRPDEFVTFRRIGGPRLNLVTDSATVIVECWSKTLSEAFGLASLVRGLLGALGGQTVYGMVVYQANEASGPVPLPDPISNQPRYTFTVSISVRGSARD